MRTVTLTMDTYINLLEMRRNELSDVVPDTIWDYFIRLVHAGLCTARDPEWNDPRTLVDNFVHVGDYGSYDRYKRDGETDEQFLARIGNTPIKIFPKERFVIFYLGLDPLDVHVRNVSEMLYPAARKQYYAAIAKEEQDG